MYLHRRWRPAGRMVVNVHTLCNYLKRGLEYVLPYHGGYRYPLPFVSAISMAVLVTYQVSSDFCFLIQPPPTHTHTTLHTHHTPHTPHITLHTHYTLHTPHTTLHTHYTPHSTHTTLHTHHTPHTPHTPHTTLHSLVYH